MKKLIALAAVAVLSLSACGKSEDKTISVKDPDSGEKVDVTMSGSDKSTMTIKSDEGSLVINSGDNARAPEGFDVYPGAKIKSSMTGIGESIGSGTGVGSAAGTMVAMTTKDTPAAVLAYYKAKLVAKGMKIGMETTTPQGGMISAGGDGDKPGALVTASATNGETTVSVMMGK
jgi:hypothetical protein